jgi:hypothetical protein
VNGRSRASAAEGSGVADTPDEIVLKRHRDLEGRRDEHWRRAATIGLAVFLLLGLLNLFGQRPSPTSAATRAAELEVFAPKRIRGGLYYEARFTVRAHRDLKNATLVLDSGWAEGITINTVEPSPVGEASRDGKLVFELGHVPAGKKHVFFLQLQVNPTNVGRRSQDVQLYDEDVHLLTIDRSVTVWP